MNRFLYCGVMRAKAPQKGLSFFNSFSLSRLTLVADPKSVHSIPFATVDVEEISGSQPAEVHNLGRYCYFSSMFYSKIDGKWKTSSNWNTLLDPLNGEPFIKVAEVDETGIQGKWKTSSNWNTLLDPLNGEPFIKVAEVDETGIQPFVESLSKCPKHGLHNPFKAPERYLLFGDVSVKAAHMLSIPKVSDFFTRLIQRVAPKSYKQALGEVYVTQKFFENFSGDQVRFLARSFAVPGDHLGQQSHGFRWPYGPVAIITPFNFPLEIPVLQLMGALYMGNKPILKVDSKVSIVMEQMMRLLHYCGLPAEDVDFINSDGKTMNKILLEEDYVAWVCDQDAYACSGQKCSAQSILFMHENWSRTSFISKIKNLAERRKLEDLTVGPVLTFTTEAMLEHLNKLLQIPGSKLLFGGEPLKNHSIPSIYGAIKPTAVYVPLEEIMKENNYELVTREIFGPFQIITDYKKEQLPMVLDALERMHAHLTAAVVSNDPLFGPAGDPRGAGIGTPEAIKLVWSCHREIIYDIGPVPRNWEIPPST
ncbi:delta-1-pyrroline-5-carboxylate dehydrogenase 12a1 [Quercus suber]|uniref:Delta-1-pyrroline-5-carboxylate dehydrogenase 12a1 n=1 Tax=Quercus suber TaxID=58331 RepID=A0AAW0KED1_QUESU